VERKIKYLLSKAIWPKRQQKRLISSCLERKIQRLIGFNFDYFIGKEIFEIFINNHSLYLDLNFKKDSIQKFLNEEIKEPIKVKITLKR